MSLIGDDTAVNFFAVDNNGDVTVTQNLALDTTFPEDYTVSATDIIKKDFSEYTKFSSLLMQYWQFFLQFLMLF